MMIAASPLPADREPESSAPPRLRVVDGGESQKDRRRARQGANDRAGVQRQAEARDELAEARRAARRRLPRPAPLIGQLALAVLEIEAGLRSASQLEKFCRPDVWELLNQRLRRRGGAFVPGNALRRVMCQEPEPGLADGVAVVGREDRVGFVAMRLDAVYGRWMVTHLTWAATASTAG